MPSRFATTTKDAPVACRMRSAIGWMILAGLGVWKARVISGTDATVCAIASVCRDSRSRPQKRRLSRLIGGLYCAPCATFAWAKRTKRFQRNKRTRRAQIVDIRSRKIHNPRRLCPWRTSPTRTSDNQEGGKPVNSAAKARGVLVLALAATAGLLAAGSASSRTDATAAKPKPKKHSLAPLIKQSKTESGLVFYGNPPTANFKALVERFNAVYPWIKVTSYDLEDNTIFSKYASEAQQGVRSADVLIASAPNLWIFAARQKYQLDFTPNGLA